MKKYIFLLVFSFLFVLSSYTQVTITNQTTLGGDGSDVLAGAVNAPDGGYYVLNNINPPFPSGNITEVGFGEEDLLLVKYDIDHNITWQKSYGGSGGEGAISLKLIGNALFLVGTSNSPVSGNKTATNFGGYDVWVIKTDLDGDIIWDKTFGGDDADVCRSVNQSGNGNLLIASMSYSGITGNKTTPNVGLGDYWIFEIDTAGNYIWENTIGSDDIDKPSEIIYFENNLYITGTSEGGVSGDKTEPLYGFADYWVVKTNATGNVIWDKALGTDGPDLGSAYISVNTDSIQVFCYGSNPMSGLRTVPLKGTGDIWRVSLDLDGNLLSQKAYGGDGDDGMGGSINLNDAFFLFSNSNSDISMDKTEDSRGGTDFWPLMLDNSGEMIWQKTIGGSGHDVFSLILVRPDDKLLLVGTSFSPVSGDKTAPNYGDFDTWIVELDITSLSNDNFTYQDFTVYPNPFQDNIVLTGENLEDVEKVEVIDALGKVISSNSFSTNFNKSTISISTEGVASGSYILNVTTIKGVQSYKMVK